MGIPLGPLREALAVARMAGPAAAKATKKTIRVLHNEGNIDSLTGMLKGKPDYNAKATMDDMMYPSSKTFAGYADDGYSAASMAKLPKGTVTNRAGTGAMRARVMGLARNAELGAMASSGKAAHAGQQIDRDILKSALVTARKSGQRGMSIGVKTSVRNMVSNRVKPGTINSELDQFTKMGGKVPRPGTIGPNPTKGGKDFINAATDYADDVRTGDSDTFLANRVPKGTVSRPSTAAKVSKTKNATAKSAAFAKRRAILNNMKNRK